MSSVLAGLNDNLTRVIAEAMQLTSFPIKYREDLTLVDLPLVECLWAFCSFEDYFCLVGMEEVLAKMLTADIMGIPEHQPTPSELHDTLKELTNIIAGKLLANYWPDKEISLPRMLNSESFTEIKRKGFWVQHVIEVQSHYQFIGISHLRPLEKSSGGALINESTDCR